MTKPKLTKEQIEKMKFDFDVPKDFNVEHDALICPICKEKRLVTYLHHSISCGLYHTGDWVCKNPDCLLNKYEMVLQ